MSAHARRNGDAPKTTRRRAEDDAPTVTLSRARANVRSARADDIVHRFVVLDRVARTV